MGESPAPTKNKSSLPAVLLLLVTIFGPPSAAFLALSWNLRLKVALVVLYEIIVFIVSFVGKVWEKLESPLVDHISQWITLKVQGITSGYLHQYCQHLIYEHEVFDVKGLSTQTAHALELEHVFVELSLDPNAVHQTSADPLAIHGTLPSGKHAIWDYLVPKLSANQHFVIIGAPGSGKTTLLKHMALTLANQKIHHRKRQKIAVPNLLPIFLFLRDYAKTIKDKPNFSLVDALQDHIQRKWQQTIPPRWISQYLAKGTCLILLDGLDEVADPFVRQQMAEWVRWQMVAYGQNRFILTSRPHGYRDNPIDGVTILEVRPFTPEQIERFVRNWYTANELKSWGKDDPGVHMRAREGAQDLLERLHRTPALYALAVNPLLLTMIANVHRFRGSLPGKRLALYAEICEVFLGKRQQARGIVQELTAAQKQQVLQPLAYSMMQQGIREIKLIDACQLIVSDLALVSTGMQPNKFLEMIQNTSGLLLERNPGVYSFAHLTFQEYLAAVHIKEVGLEQILVSQVGDAWWHETIRLYSAQADATALIIACLLGSTSSVPALTLAIECLQEALKVQISVRLDLDILLREGIEDPDLERRRLVAETLLARRLSQMIPLDEGIFVDTSLITCAEYQIFLDDQKSRGSFHQPDHWMIGTFPPGQGHLPILGVRPSDVAAFCTWLTEREAGTWRYRMLTEDEQKRLEKNKDIAVVLSSGTGYWINEGKNFAWEEGIPPSSDHINQKIQELFVLDLNGDLTHILNRDIARVLGRPIDIALALDRLSGHLSYAANLTRALNLDRDLALALDHVFAHNLNLVSTLDLNHALDYTGALDLDHTFALALDHDLDRALALALRGHMHVLEPYRNHAFNLNHVLVRARTFALTRDFNSSNVMLGNFDQKEDALLFRWFIRYLTQVLVRYLRYCSNLQPSPRTWKERLFFRHENAPQYKDIFESAISIYLDLYLACALLELRIKGSLPAWEGILLVKESKERR